MLLYPLLNIATPCAECYYIMRYVLLYPTLYITMPYVMCCDTLWPIPCVAIPYAVE